MKATLAVATLFSLTLMGCVNFSGLDSSSSFSCKAPDGVNCQSISGVYANSMQNNLPSQQVRHEGNKKADGEKAAPPKYTTLSEEKTISPRDMSGLTSGLPLRQAPIVLRVWVAPWEDSEGDLHDQSYFYTVVNSGKWVIEANRANIRNQFKTIYPLKQDPISLGQQGSSDMAQLAGLPKFPATQQSSPQPQAPTLTQASRQAESAANSARIESDATKKTQNGLVP